AEAHGELDRPVEVCPRRALRDLDGLRWREQRGAVEGADRVEVALAVLHQTTVRPIERAVPAIWRFAASRSFALRSGIFVFAISASCASVTVPAPARPGVTEPFSMPAAWRSSTGVGGVFRMKLNVRSSKIVISTGTIVPRWFSVCALYILQKSMIATPCGPSAVPTGGAGVAWPAGIWILTTAATFFFAMVLPRECGRKSLAGRARASLPG